jgi:hypothetical protein
MIKETEKMQRYFIIPVQIEVNLISLNMIWLYNVMLHKVNLSGSVTST